MTEEQLNIIEDCFITIANSWSEGCSAGEVADTLIKLQNNFPTLVETFKDSLYGS